MATEIGFYLDEQVARVVAEGLRRRGIDVVTVGQLGMLGASDLDHLARAISLQRVIFTQDADFLRIHRSGLDHAGIVFCRQGGTVGEIIRGLVLIQEVLTLEEMQGQVQFL